MPVCSCRKSYTAGRRDFPETLEAGKFIVGSGEVTLNDFEQCWFPFSLDE
jgi:hypothetical protein